MASTTIDSSVLAALHVLLEKRGSYVNLEDLIMPDLRSAMENLVSKGYAEKSEDDEDVDLVGDPYHKRMYYHLTPEGLEFFDKVLRFATEQFYS